jgi:hypothetical protein
VIFEKDVFGLPVKRDETRHWPTNVRGRIAIHAAKSLEGKKDIPEEWLLALGLSWKTMPFGCILGTVDLETCWKTEDIVERRSRTQLQWGNYAPGRFAFELVNPVLLPEPIPYRGAQGFFNVELSL